ncbi:hypothetical protein [Chitinophaga sp. YIM B06452]|uniref:hypothetical protein n=1 Tax=Chitinophaga sp. YIM B06452 TaxID=3082158 RepID=UPI0031FE8E3D
MKKFLTYLIDSDKRSYEVNENNLQVVVRGIPTPLKWTFDGWEDTVFNWTRHSTYWGMTRSWSIPIRFVKDGAQILWSLAASKGVESQITFVMQRRDSNDGVFKTIYTGEVNLPDIVKEDHFVEVRLLEGGLTKDIKANEGTTYEFPVSAGVDLTIDGILLRNASNSLLVGGNIPFTYGNHLPQIDFIGSEGNVEDNTRSTSLHTFGNVTDGDIAGTNDPYYEADATGPVSLKWNWSFRSAYYFQELSFPFPHLHGPDPNLRIKVDIRIYNGGTLKSATTVYSTSNASEAGQVIDYNPPTPPVFAPVTHKIQGEQEFNLDAGDQVYFLVWGSPWKQDAGALTGGIEWVRFYYDVLDSEMSISAGYSTIAPPTTIKALPALTLYKQLVSQMTGGSFEAVSDYLSNELKGLLITSGDAIRGIGGAVVKTNFKDFFAAINATRNIGFGVEVRSQKEVAVLERKSYFFQNEPIVTLGEVSGHKVSFAQDLVYNTISVGYENQTYDDLNGRDEFNVTQQYETALKKVVKRFELLSPYRADMYGIEFTRRNLEGKSTTDNTADSDVFIIDAEETEPGKYIIHRIAYDTITGLIAGNTAFNVELSPKRMLLQHGNFIRSFIDKGDTTYIRYRTGNKNSKLSTTLNGVTISESGDVQVGALDDPLFIPWYAEFEAPVPSDLPDKIDVNSYGVIPYLKNGRVVEGLVMDVGMKPVTNDAMVYKVLLTANTDLTQL